MSILVYEYKNCSTCQKAVKFLKAKGVEFETRPIVDQPPSVTELRRMLGFLKAAGGGLKNLFNTSGVQYREQGIAARLAEMTETEALELLAANGKLVKRPFLLVGRDGGAVGFREDEWRKLL